MTPTDLTLLCLWLLMVLRGVIVHRVVLREINRIAEIARCAALEGKEWKHYFNQLDHSVVMRLVRMLDLTKWTQRDFFPNEKEP